MEDDKPAPQPSFDPALIQQLLDNQTVELGLRQQEQDRKKLEVENAHIYALRLLDANVADRINARELENKTNKRGNWVFLFLSIGILVALCYALHLNKDQLVTEFLRTIIQLLVGGLGGYSIRAMKDKSDKKDG